MREIRRIPLDALPTRLHTLDEVAVWHTRRVIVDSDTYLEAGQRLGICEKTLWDRRRRFGIDDLPRLLTID